MLTGMTDRPAFWIVLLGLTVAVLALAVATDSTPGTVLGGINLGWTFRSLLAVVK